MFVTKHSITCHLLIHLLKLFFDHFDQPGQESVNIVTAVYCLSGLFRTVSTINIVTAVHCLSGLFRTVSTINIVTAVHCLLGLFRTVSTINSDGDLYKVGVAVE